MALFARKDLDMLSGSLWDKIILFAIPLAFTGVLQQLFNAADVAVLGRFVSSEAMAAVGTDVPVIGTVLKKSAIARFAAILAILQRSGLSIVDSMTIVADTINNAFFSHKMDAVKEKIHSGEAVATSLTEVGGFSPLALSLITVGENTGSMEEMLSELSNHYDAEVNIAVEQLTEWIGPVLIIALGAVVLFFALAIFLPMWDLVKFV